MSRRYQRKQPKPRIGKIGRPTKLSEETIWKFCEIIADGNYIKVAASALNISIHTVTRWLWNGKKDTIANRDTIFAKFFMAVQEAHTEAERRALRIIRDAMNSFDQDTAVDTAKWYLQHRYPDRWGRRTSKVQLVTPKDQPLQHNVTFDVAAKEALKGLSDEELEILEKARRKIDDVVSNGVSVNGQQLKTAGRDQDDLFDDDPDADFFAEWDEPSR